MVQVQGSFLTIHCLFQAALDTVRGTKLANIASEVVKPLDVGKYRFYCLS